VFLCNTYEDSIPNAQTLTNANLLDNTPAAGFDCQLESVNGVIEDDNSAEKNDSYMDVEESSVVDERKWLCPARDYFALRIMIQIVDYPCD
jgi:hypothetical protein